MEKTENKKYIILSITLIVAIASVIIFVILPKYSRATPEKIIEKIDFSNSEWVEQYVENSVGLYGKDLFLSTAYSYNIRSNKMIVTYASQNSIEEVRDYYLTLPGAEQTGRNDETSLNITAKANGQELRVYNYYSSISRVIELELTLDASAAEQVIVQLEKAFPAEELAKISGIGKFVSEDLFGGYVRYQYDNLDNFSHPYIPIYSRAYIYDGSEDEFNSAIINLNQEYPGYRYDETQNTHYYKINGQIVAISFFVTDSDEKVISIGLQKDHDGE